MPIPNLFTFATSELSQDAFICWLASWASPHFKAENPPLYTTASEFVKRLVAIGNGPPVDEITSIEIERQYHNMDVFLKVNQRIAINIEDKTDTSDHSRQLTRYVDIVKKLHPELSIAAVYFKTGDQCDYGSAEKAGYGCFLRDVFLQILRNGKARQVKNDIFTDFLTNLENIEKAVNSFSTTPVSEWKDQGPEWRGFFTLLRAKLDGGDWVYFGHGGGATPVFRWCWRGNKYLRLGEGSKGIGDKGPGQLAFRIELANEADKKVKWSEWLNRLEQNQASAGIEICKAPRKPGNRMTVAFLKGDYRQKDSNGMLDIDRTIELLKRAEKLMDIAFSDKPAK